MPVLGLAYTVPTTKTNTSGVPLFSYRKDPSMATMILESGVYGPLHLWSFVIKEGNPYTQVQEANFKLASILN